MKKIICLIVLGFIIGVSNVGLAELYQWVDENGVVHYSNTMVADENDNLDEEDLKTFGERKSPAAPAPESKRNQDIVTAIEDNQKHAEEENQKLTESKEESKQIKADQEAAMRDRLILEIAHCKREIKNNEEKLELTKVELKEAAARYDEVKRESYTDTVTHRKRLQKATSRKMRLENRIKTTKRTILDYKDLIKSHKSKLAKLSK